LQLSTLSTRCCGWLRHIPFSDPSGSASWCPVLSPPYPKHGQCRLRTAILWPACWRFLPPWGWRMRLAGNRGGSDIPCLGVADLLYAFYQGAGVELSLAHSAPASTSSRPWYHPCWCHMSRSWSFGSSRAPDADSQKWNPQLAIQPFVLPLDSTTRYSTFSTIKRRQRRIPSRLCAAWADSSKGRLGI
jgi:hypothetical protein